MAFMEQYPIDPFTGKLTQAFRDKILEVLSKKYPDHSDCKILLLPLTKNFYEFIDMSHPDLALTMTIAFDEIPDLSI